MLPDHNASRPRRYDRRGLSPLSPALANGESSGTFPWTKAILRSAGEVPALLGRTPIGVEAAVARAVQFDFARFARLPVAGPARAEESPGLIVQDSVPRLALSITSFL